MWTLSDKLTYLEDTKKMIREKLKAMGASVSDEDTFRSYVEKIADLAPDTNYIVRGVEYLIDNSVDERPVEETILGNWKFDCKNAMICPRIVYPSNTTGEYIIPFSARGANAKHDVSVTGITVSYHRIVAPETCSLKIALNMVKPAMLILPERVNLVQYTLNNGIRNNGHDTSSFKNGLGFGKSVHSSVSTWICNVVGSTSARRIVKFPNGFRLDSGNTLYLGKIHITKECMQEMVRNLYDYIGTGETTEVTRTISVGNINKSLLTSDEIQLAKDKGWTITA